MSSLKIREAGEITLNASICKFISALQPSWPREHSNVALGSLQPINSVKRAALHFKKLNHTAEHQHSSTQDMEVAMLFKKMHPQQNASDLHSASEAGQVVMTDILPHAPRAAKADPGRICPGSIFCKRPGYFHSL